MRFSTGFLIGMILGATAVLLTTPKSGEELKHEARSWIDGVLAEGRKAAAARRADLETRLNELKAG